MQEQTPIELLRFEEKRRRYKCAGFFAKIGLLTIFCLVPFMFPGFKIFDLMMKIIIFATLTASFDILLGYAGIISFGHSMFFGIGAYCVAFLIGKYGAPSYLNLVISFIIGTLFASILAVLVSYCTLRVKALFFAMVTMAFAELAAIITIKLSRFTGGEDGISLGRPGVFAPSFELGNFLGIEINGRVLTYYLILFVCFLLFIGMLRFVHSPLGKVLKAIRDNPQRVEALGNRPFIFQLIAMVFACTVATIIGGLYALWTCYVSPESCLSVGGIMIDVLLMTIVGGIGTIYGGILGAAFVKIAATLLPDLQSIAKSLFPDAGLLHNAMERWLLVVGFVFILVVFFFPKGMIGSFQEFSVGRSIWVGTKQSK
jgi:branched-chain amino acid transport system permease protein